MTTSDQEEDTTYGCYLAILPRDPSIQPSQLKDLCLETTAKYFDVSSATHHNEPSTLNKKSIIQNVHWTHDRTSYLHHPALPTPLAYLEITCYVVLMDNSDNLKKMSTTEVENTLSHEISKILSENDHFHVIGNIELILSLRGTVIPLLEEILPLLTIEDYACHGEEISVSKENILENAFETFISYGLTGLSNSISNEERIELHSYAMDKFRLLIDALDEYKEKNNNLNRIRKLHFREIMQRDENRFDFRLDYDDITTQNLVDEGARRGYDIQATFEMVDDVTFSTFPIWKKLGLKTGKWIPLVRRILGNDCRLIKGGCVISLPGTNMQYWHSDGIHIGSVSTFENPNQASNTHALCVFVPLIDLTEETGYTEFWAGSHKYDKLLSKKGEQSIPGGTKGKLKRGSCLLYDYRTIHRGTSNMSDRERPVCYFLYTKKGYEDVEDQNFVSSSVFGL